MHIKNDRAVSPVVGVMLMLVITIIIAAVVSGFAGGLTGGTSKASQASIKAEYSQSTGLTINHMGGDVINTLKTKIFVAPTTDFGGYDQLRWEVNTSVVQIQKSGTDKPWFDARSSSSGLARTFQAGETAFVNATNLGQVQPDTYGTNDASSSSYGFRNSAAVGQRFILNLVDDSGKSIVQTEVQIKP